MDKDFDSYFFTSIHHNETGLCFVCFDCGWQIVNDRYHMKDFPEQAWLMEADFKLNK